MDIESIKELNRKYEEILSQIPSFDKENLKPSKRWVTDCRNLISEMSKGHQSDSVLYYRRAIFPETRVKSMFGDRAQNIFNRLYKVYRSSKK